MNNEQFKSTENTEKQEAHESPEALKSVEKSAEEIGEQMIELSSKEVADFQQEGATEIDRMEARAEKDGLIIDNADREELQKIDNEAIVAKEELVKEIDVEEPTPPPIPQEFIRATPPPLPQEARMSPPPLPDEYVQKFSQNIPPPIPQEYIRATPPPLPGAEPQPSKNLENKEIQDESFELYLGKSKVGDKAEALQKLMHYAGAESAEDFKNKLSEKDEDGDNKIDVEFSLFTPDSLGSLRDPSTKLLQRIKNVGDALGYTFMNTPGYESQVDEIINRFRRNGESEKAQEAEKIFGELATNFEKEKDKSEFKKLDENLLKLTMDAEGLGKYIEEIRNLPPDDMVDLYNGFNNGGYDVALDILNGAAKGLEQRSGPCVSLTPIGQFWKGVGFKYSLRRDQIKFPGEDNPNAVIEMTAGLEGIPDTGSIINEIGSLPLDQFEAEIVRSKFTLPDPELEKELSEKLRQFSEERSVRKNA